MGILAFIAIVSAVYSQSYRHAFIYDDHEVILAHPAPQSTTDVLRYFTEKHFYGLPYYRPIVRTSLLVQKAIHGPNAAPFHLFNICLAVVAGLLSWWILAHPAFHIGRSLSGLAAMLFVVHPAFSSCVYPIASGRETLLPLVLLLACFGSWIRSGAWYFVAIFFFGCALLGKEQTIVLPVLFVLADWLLLRVNTDSTQQSGSRIYNLTLRYVPVIALTILYLIVRRNIIGEGQYQLALTDTRPGMLGWLGPFWSFCYSMQTLVAPYWDLSYEPRFHLWFSPVRFAISVVVVACLGISSCILGRQSRRIAFFWFAWFVVCQLPTANILRQQAEFDERYVALSVLSGPAVAAMLIAHLRHLPSFFFKTILIAAIGCCSWISFDRAQAFVSDMAFADHWIKANPRSAEAWHFKGARLLIENRLPEALACVQTALDVNPEFLEARHTLGRIFARSGQMDLAAVEFQKVVAAKPDHFEALSNLGFALSRLGRVEEAVAQYNEAIRNAPRNVRLRINLAYALLKLGRNEEAADQFRAALMLDPRNPDALDFFRNPPTNRPAT